MSLSLETKRGGHHTLLCRALSCHYFVPFLSCRSDFQLLYDQNHQLEGLNDFIAGRKGKENFLNLVQIVQNV
jgi:hypothetical protein